MKLRSVLFLLFPAALGLLALAAFHPRQTFDLKASITRGTDVYLSYCLSCHGEQGAGIENVYPPLVKSDYLMADKKRSILQVLNGAKGEMKVNGKIYNAEMTGFELTDQQVSDVLNYSRNSWGNKGGAIKPEEVSAARKAVK
ncbi:MAG TPA: cytochrome c [Puia sp.]